MTIERFLAIQVGFGLDTMISTLEVYVQIARASGTVA